MLRTTSFSYFVLSLLFFISLRANAQESDFENRLKYLKERISNTQAADKLLHTDSLITLVEFNEDYDYSTLIKNNIEFALQLDSTDLATKHTADFIYYHNAVLGKPKEGLEIFKNYKGKEREGKINIHKTNLYIYGSDSYLYTGDYKKAIEELQQAEIYAKITKEKQRISSVTFRLGTIQAHSGQFAEASKNLQFAVKSFQELQDTLQYLGSVNVLSVLYSQNDFFEEAKKLREEAIELSLQSTNQPFLSDLYYNSGADYRLKKDYKNWVKYLNMAREVNEVSEQRGYRLPMILSDLVIAAAITDSISKAETYFNEYKTQVPDYDGVNNRGYFLGALKNVAFAKKNYPEALQYGEEHLNLKLQENSFVEISNAQKFMADVYDAIGNKENQNLHLVAYYKIKDSISSVKNVQNLSYYQTIFETEKRDFKIKAQENDIALLEEREKVRTQWYIIGAVLLLGVFGILWLVRSRNFARNKQKLQESFTKDILKTQENERARIASELHDSVGQKLLILKNSLSTNENQQTKEIDLVGETIKEVREMSHNLHPFQFEKLGLQQSLINMVETFQKNSNIFYSEEIEIPENFIKKEQEIYIFRMLQEAITNVEKHSEAVACNLSTVIEQDQLVFTLKDNGKGFKFIENNGLEEGLGMKTLKERARYIDAKLLIDSVPEKGTTITLKIKRK